MTETKRGRVVCSTIQIHFVDTTKRVHTQESIKDKHKRLVGRVGSQLVSYDINVVETFFKPN